MVLTVLSLPCYLMGGYSVTGRGVVGVGASCPTPSTPPTHRSDAYPPFNRVVQIGKEATKLLHFTAAAAPFVV